MFCDLDGFAFRPKMFPKMFLYEVALIMERNSEEAKLDSCHSRVINHPRLLIYCFWACLGESFIYDNDEDVSGCEVAGCEIEKLCRGKLGRKQEEFYFASYSFHQSSKFHSAFSELLDEIIWINRSVIHEKICLSAVCTSSQKPISFVFLVVLQKFAPKLHHKSFSMNQDLFAINNEFWL